jgi:hypothetical protein
MARIKDLTTDGSISGSEKLVATDSDLSTKNITVDALKQYITVQSPIPYSIPSTLGTAGQVLVAPSSGTTLEWDDQTGGGTGTVTSITASSPLTGGTITTTGTIGLTVGNLTETSSSILTITGGTGAVVGSGATIAVSQATTSTSGYLSSTDWNTFNNKQGTRDVNNYTNALRSVIAEDTSRFIYATNANFEYTITEANDASISIGDEFYFAATGGGVIKVTSDAAVYLNGSLSANYSLTQYKPTRLIKVADASYIIG